MQELKEATKEESKQSGGMVFYPRSYHTTSDINTSYAIGVNHYGKDIVVFIIPTASSIAAANDKNTAQTIPTLLEFSDTGRKANNPCFASSNNCQKQQEGVMVLEQVTENKELSGRPEYNGLPVYQCTWASVLREYSDMPKSPVGTGYMEIGFSYKVSPEVNDMVFQYNELISDIESGRRDDVMDAEQQREELYKAIICGRKKWFVAVMLRSDEIFSLSDLSNDFAKKTIIPILKKYTMKGFYGGVIFRVRHGKTVIKELSSSCNMVFDYQLKEPKKVEEVVDTYMKFYGNKLLRESANHGYTVDIIPTIRFNCGPMGTINMSNEFKEPGVPKMLKTYIESDYHQDPMANYQKKSAFLFADIGIRLAVIREGKEGAGNYLVSSAHAFSAPKGNVLTIGASGESEYNMKKNN